MPRDTGLTPSGTATFGEWLRRELDRAGLSQTELARRMGASPGTISTWANGRRGRSLGRCWPRRSGCRRNGCGERRGDGVRRPNRLVA